MFFLMRCRAFLGSPWPVYGGFVGAWQSVGNHGINAQRFDGTGARVGTELRTNANTGGAQRHSDIEWPTDGDILANLGAALADMILRQGYRHAFRRFR